MNQKPTIHIIEDDDAVRDSIGLMLEVEGFIARTYASCAAFLREARLDANCCLMVDMQMPDISGLGLLGQLRRDGVNTPAIVMTGMVNDSIRCAVERAGAVLLEKPYRIFEVIHSIETAIGRKNL